MSTVVKNLKILQTKEKSVWKVVKKMEKEGFEVESIEELTMREPIRYEPSSRQFQSILDRPSHREWLEKKITFRKIEKIDIDPSTN